MTLYVIRSTAQTPRYVRWSQSPSQLVDWTRSLSDAKKFDSMTLAELFAIECGVERYQVVPVESTTSFNQSETFAQR